MSVPKGFKQTEVGVIPEDWEVIPTVCLVEAASPICYGIVQVGQNTDNGVPIVAIKYVKDINTSPLHQASVTLEQSYSRSRVKGGDVLISIKGTIGRVGIVPDGFIGNISRELARLRIKEKYSAEYIAHQLEADKTQIRISKSVVGTTRLEFSIFALRQFSLPIPSSLHEQTAIAAALSDMDALIEGVEKLLEKKRRIKQGAMQELLRPKAEWRIKTLGDLCTPSKKRIDPKTSQQIYKCIELEHVGQESGRLLGYALTDELKSQKTLFNSGDTLFGKLRPYLKKFLFTGFDGCCTTEIWALQPTNYIHNKLLFYIMQTDAVLEAANQSEGTKMPRADWKKVKDVNISIPPKQEQEKIASILSDMDSEIEQLEIQLAKYRQLKTGMMQELLTGKKRLT